ncbi:hypothetical protein [Oscillibacter sp.]|uniref:hypothetical protein n=1 Tax=Oscillibacter sp. TaxID=1945593 RepID=UPI00260953C3|nr:hypothetical protein [Oscillibacter sp.]MDD3346799.1 hypothetical protein [Oscillibacter sp.]
MKSTNRTSWFYLCSLGARTAAFLFLLVYALAAPARFSADLAAAPLSPTPLLVLWLALMGSMVFRLFPSRMESLGCQKEFARCFLSTGHTPGKAEIWPADRGALRVLALWAAVNALFFLLYWRGWVDGRFLVLLTGFYGVCDIVCILFFCPFQVWLMGNRCCTTCRIYNWDYLMLCTPLLALPGFYARSACLLAAVIFFRWELSYRLHPERFFESGNASLQCSACQEHLCRYKRALSTLPKSHCKKAR